MNCENCGKEIGPGQNDRLNPESCGDRECNQAVRDMYRQIDEEARERAHDDGYERYR